MLPFCFEHFTDYACLVEQKQHFTTVLQNFDNITHIFSAEKWYQPSELSWRGMIRPLLPKCWGKLWGRAQLGHPKNWYSVASERDQSSLLSVPPTVFRSCFCTHPRGLKNIFIFSMLWGFTLLRNILTVETWPLQLTKSKITKAT